jgi:peptide/nickel transport system substrate-binding protein
VIVRRWRRARLFQVAAAGVAALAVAGLTACTSSQGGATGAAPSASASPGAAAAPGGNARVALPPGVTPDYIWPYTPASHAGQENVQQFQMLMYRPLYVFGGNGPSTSVNYLLSPAEAPAYSDGGKTVTITMKGWRWSDGEAVNPSDVLFWLNMMAAEPGRYYGYAKGELPDNLASYHAVSPTTVVLHLKAPVSRIWFTYNQLAEITPMPAAWDVTASGASPGSGGCAADSAADHWARCSAVYHFLAGQAADTGGYASSQLWRVVDGPWQLSSFSAASSGPVASFVPNPEYSGSPKPQLARLTYYAYPSDAAEYQALRHGQLDVGYVPDANLTTLTGTATLPPASPLGTAFTLGTQYPYGIQYLQVNFDNPALGPAFRQLYVRQALQELINQVGMIDSVDRGYGYPTSGGVPAQPGNQWVPAVQNTNGGQGPYPYSVANALSLLTSRGWRAAGGVMTCESPGTGPAQCGAGVTAGTRLSMTLGYVPGNASVRAEVTQLVADMAQAQVRLAAVPQSAATMTAAAAACQASRSGCGWQLLDSAGWVFTGPGYEPTGGLLFGTGARSNPGGYSDHEMDQLIALTQTSDSLSVFQQYAAYTADQLPDLWMPDTFTVTATSARLASVTPAPLATLLPEYWYFTR